MATRPSDDDDFSFEIDDETPENVAEKPELEVEDDTPEEDRGREPLPKEIVDELEADELDDYSEKVKVRLKQMKKVWHDERREKEQAYREQQEALAFAQQVAEENKRLKAYVDSGTQQYMTMANQAAEAKLDKARRDLKAAQEAFDADAIVAAQEFVVIEQVVERGCGHVVRSVGYG